MSLYSVYRSLDLDITYLELFRQFVYNTSLSNITSIFIAYIKTTFFKTCSKITLGPQQIQETHVN